MRNDRGQPRSPASGMAILALIALVIAGIYYLDELTRLATPRYTIVGVFPDGGAIRVGTPVWLAGREVGRVRSVALQSVPGTRRTGLIARLELRREVRELIRRDSRISIGAPTPLADPLVRIRPGTTRAPPLEPLDTLREREDLDVQAIMQRLADVFTGLDTVLSTAQRLGSAVDERRAELEILDAGYRRASGELDALMRALDDGSLPMLTDSAFVGRVTQLVEATAQMGRRAEELAGRIRATAEDGTTLDARLRTAGERMRGVSRALAALRRTLNAPNSTLSRLQRDSALAVALRNVRAQIDSLVADARREGPGLLF